MTIILLLYCPVPFDRNLLNLMLSILFRGGGIEGGSLLTYNISGMPTDSYYMYVVHQQEKGVLKHVRETRNY